jgi:mono/diheme cytochrome c family protein
MHTGKNWVTQSTRLVGLMLGIALFTAIPSLAQEDEIIAGGKLKYQQYCANCHGPAGKGDGEMAKLLVLTPTDLTQLRTRNQGEFPFWRIYRVIDGRETIRGHGDRKMPLWGFVFQVEEEAEDANSQEDLVRGRIWQLVYYLNSIQEK